MGVDIHGPWVERYFTDRSGKERSTCVATLPIFDRDYTAFGIMASGVRGQYEEAITEPRGFPDEPCWQWQQHAARDVMHGIEYRRQTLADMPDLLAAIPDVPGWREMWDKKMWREREYANCFGHSWLTTDEVEEAQRRYLRYHEKWREADPSSFMDRSFGPYPGFAVALAVMRETEALYGQSCRLTFCFDC